MIELLTGWLNNLRNADHVGLTTQIYDNVKDTDLKNDLYKSAVEALGKAIADEDEAYKKTQKDWAVEELKTADQQMDAYMKGIRLLLRGHAAMPDSEETKQKATELLHYWKDFDFKLNDSYSAESAKVINMFQEIEKRKSDAEAVGVWSYFEKAQQTALKVQSLLNDRFSELASRTVGEVKIARTATDLAIKQLYTVLSSMQAFAPTETLTQLLKKLRAIEDYARVYYLRGTASGRDDTPAEIPDIDGGPGDLTPPDDEDDSDDPPLGGD